MGLAGHHRIAGFEAGTLRQHQRGLGRRAKRKNLKKIGMRGNDIQGVHPHRAGRAQDCDALFLLTHGNRGRLKRHQHHGQWQGGQQGIHAVQHAAVAWQQAA